VDDVDVGKPRLPWTAASDGVGRATAFGGGRRAPGRGRERWPWARGGAAWDRQPWAGATAVGSVRRLGERCDGGAGTAAGRRDGGGAAGERGGGRAGRRRDGGGAATSAGGVRTAVGRTAARAQRRESALKETERKKKGTTVVILNNSRRPGGVADGSYLIAVGCTLGRRELVNPRRLR
jgi:hypothetical protein